MHSGLCEHVNALCGQKAYKWMCTTLLSVLSYGNWLMNVDIKWAKEKRKGYPHFDAPISLSEAVQLVTNPLKVAEHQFFPFLEYTKKTRKFVAIKKKFDEEGDCHYDSHIKLRPIKFAAHRDAYIYSYYREILYAKYEQILINKGISDVVIAYRKIPLLDRANSGKCNIHYASEAFAEVRRRKNCVAITLDIQNFFESLDHSNILKNWLEVMGFASLPRDHQKVYDSITQYHVVDLDQCLEQLGYLELYKRSKSKGQGNAIHKKYSTSRKEMFSDYIQLCKPEVFREKIAGKNNNLIKPNPNKDYGIPQGSPLSDIIANIYMMEFDTILSELANKLGAYYRRYSDDILWICNNGDEEIIIKETHSALSSQGNKLFLGKKKQTISYFVNGMLSKGNKFEYLGFGYDGIEPYIKEQTIQRYKRRVVHGIRATFNKLKSKAKEMGMKDWKKSVDRAALHSRYRFPDLKYNKLKKISDKDSRNFMTYVIRAGKIMNIDFVEKHFKTSKSFINKVIQQEIHRLDS